MAQYISKSYVVNTFSYRLLKQRTYNLIYSFIKEISDTLITLFSGNN
jgi:hypothetical protein